ncbi:hypothetical protein [Bacillus smithii]|uniref:hypothetical protein n=1 Tax=Bacillus smithii TaxID=1479 RepID=UPI0030C90B08
MDNTFNWVDLVQSLQNKLAAAEFRASQFEAIAKYKDTKIKELESKLKEFEKKNKK